MEISAVEISEEKKRFWGELSFKFLIKCDVKYFEGISFRLDNTYTCADTVYS